jgi:hypothetical protein
MQRSHGDNSDGGVLDPLIDDFQTCSACRTVRGPQLPHDQLRIAYARRGVAQLNVDDDRSGFVDLPLAAGWQWLASDTGALAAWLTVEAAYGSTWRADGQRCARRGFFRLPRNARGRLTAGSFSDKRTTKPGSVGVMCWAPSNGTWSARGSWAPTGAPGGDSS